MISLLPYKTIIPVASPMGLIDRCEGPPEAARQSKSERLAYLFPIETQQGRLLPIVARRLGDVFAKRAAWKCYKMCEQQDERTLQAVVKTPGVYR